MTLFQQYFITRCSSSSTGPYKVREENMLFNSIDLTCNWIEHKIHTKFIMYFVLVDLKKAHV